MSNIITGLFNNQRDYKKLETDSKTPDLVIQIILYI